jgi:REP element-mobilizing transposase RayT
LPAAYLLTIRAYGTWLHGDEAGAHHRRRFVYGGPRIEPSERWRAAEEARLRQPPILLDARCRALAEQVAQDVCGHRGWRLLAVNARTNHVHLVVAAHCEPEVVLRSIKSWTTRRLVEARLVALDGPLWARHGSTICLWTLDSVDRAIDYVVHRQDSAQRKASPLPDGRGTENGG